MDWEKIGLVLMTGVFAWYLYKRLGKGGFKAIMEHSRNSPQHWGTYVFLMVIVVAFVYFLIKL